MSKKRKKSTTKHHDFRHLVKDVQGENKNHVGLEPKKEEDVHSSKDVRKELKKSVIFIIGFMIALIVIFYIVTYTNILASLLNFVGLKGVYGK